MLVLNLVLILLGEEKERSHSALVTAVLFEWPGKDFGTQAGKSEGNYQAQLLSYGYWKRNGGYGLI